MGRILQILGQLENTSPGEIQQFKQTIASLKQLYTASFIQLIFTGFKLGKLCYKKQKQELLKLQIEIEKQNEIQNELQNNYEIILNENTSPNLQNEQKTFCKPKYVVNKEVQVEEMITKQDQFAQTIEQKSAQNSINKADQYEQFTDLIHFELTNQSKSISLSNQYSESEEFNFYITELKDQNKRILKILFVNFKDEVSMLTSWKQNKIKNNYENKTELELQIMINQKNKSFCLQIPYQDMLLQKRIPIEFKNGFILFLQLSS